MPDRRDDIPAARAVRGAGRSVVVPECPYCGRPHRHFEPAPEGSRREADCFAGEYALAFGTQREGTDA